MAHTGTVVKFIPVPGFDTEVKCGVSQTISTKLQCITGMKEYETKSLEELRFEDYVARKSSHHQMCGTPLMWNNGNKCINCGFNDNLMMVNKSPFGSNMTNSSFGNGSFTSFVGNPASGNSSIFCSSKPTFGTGVFGSCVNNSPLEHKSVFNPRVPTLPQKQFFAFPENTRSFANRINFGTAKNKFSSNNNILSPTEKAGRFFNVCSTKANSFFGNTSTFTGNAQNVAGTQSTASSELPCPMPVPADQQDSSFGSTSNPKLRRIRKNIRLTPNRPANLDGVSSSATKTLQGSKEPSVVQSTSISKLGFDFSQLKSSEVQAGIDLKNSDKENYEKGIKKLVLDLQGFIECPVCFGNLDSSLKQCENGHGICGSCFSNVVKCPTCQHNYLPYKPTLLCQILERLPKPCIYSDKGCDKIFFDKKEDHEIFCKYRPTLCNFGSCKWEGTVEGVIDHVKNCKNSTGFNKCEVHFPNVQLSQVYVFDKTQDANLYSAVIYQNELFWKSFNRDSSSKIISYKVYHITSAKPKQKFYLVVSFNKGEIEFKTCIAASLDSKSNSDKGGEMSFCVPDEDLERFYDAKAKGYGYTLKLIVEDIHDDNKVV